ncbi:hypothetical protein HRF87_23300 [Bacillus sp. CRN 9]|nr:hypothetical protein [Bacillus sp. CRN 9]
MTEKPTFASKEEELIHLLSIITPVQRLTQLSNGVAPTEAQLKALTKLEKGNRLPTPVINVLIEYVMLKTDVKFSPVFAEKLGGHLARLRVSTAKEAMVLLQKQHRMIQGWLLGSQKTSLMAENGRYIKMFTYHDTYRKFTELVQHNGFKTDDEAFKYLVDKLHEEQFGNK